MLHSYSSKIHLKARLKFKNFWDIHAAIPYSALALVTSRYATACLYSEKLFNLLLCKLIGRYTLHVLPNPA